MKNIFLWGALVVSFTGFLFGYDASIISGVNLPIKSYWQISDWYHGAFIVSMSLWGTLAGALAGGYPTDRLGRKLTLIIVGILFIVSSAGTALAVSPLMLSVFRFLGGIACGLGSIAAPAYLSEVSTARHRGKFVVLFQLSLVIGILVAYLSAYIFNGFHGDADWRWMLGAKLVPSVVFTIAALFIEESPRWLISKGKNIADAQRKLDLFIGGDTKEAVRADDNPVSEERLFSKKYRRILILATLITFFNQMSGISFVLNYAPQILGRAGFGTTESLLNVVLIGVVNLIFTLVGVALIDRTDRRRLMIIGSAGYIISLSMISCCFYFDLPGRLAIVFVMLFIVSHAIGQGAVIWVFLSEIFPTKVRAFGQAWSSGLLNGFAALITLLGAVVINAVPAWIIFAGFAVLMVMQLIFAIVLMPETKGVALEEIERRLTSPFGMPLRGSSGTFD